MGWFKRGMWRATIAIAGLVLLLILTVWVPALAGAYEGASGLAIAGPVQATPTVDVTATMTALNEEKLRQEIQQLKDQNNPDLLGWLRTNAAILLSTLVIVVGGLIGLFRWFGDRRSEREKRAEERFQSTVTGLVDVKEGARIGAAILLRTFLRQHYEQFYVQTFDLAVAHLRLKRVSPNSSEPLDPLTQALTTVFKESFPKARRQLNVSDSLREGQQLDAGYIQLDSANLALADLRHAWMPQASLKKAVLIGAKLNDVNLKEADLSHADLRMADLKEADLTKANLSGADLCNADLRSIILSGADLSGADLSYANFSEWVYMEPLYKEPLPTFVTHSGARLTDANLSGANLAYANLKKAWLIRTNLSGTNIQDADIDHAHMISVKGLTQRQLNSCKARGAIVEEDSTSSPSESVASPPMQPQSNNTQAFSAAPAQVSPPSASTDGSSATSSQPSTEP